ncbi:T7SS effector LXG polymorphic toxin [Bacillus safensis]|uniref:T7SS effector LXG polymorphic toxin n=3 Tax=Bacillus safensis TaxID=561879 RepID=UPI002041641D|nr:T7SS effector LXG polymorphic toxin [Bacillus safensis]MCM2989749.1 T7SS effector LXG polymorphic toxin [Bacillus safensis]
MKTLDVQALHHGIDQTLTQLKQQSQHMKSLENQINQIISLDGALKGEAGEAIRAFYAECHIPFLQFFQATIEEYSAALKKIKNALHAFESNENGFISQSFLEHELDQGLKNAERAVSDIMSDVSSAIGKVSHIIDLPTVDESAFQASYQKAWMNISKTIGTLHAFDREQASVLNETKSSLHTMKQYIDTLGKMFTGPKIEIISYQKGSIFKDGIEEKISSTISGLNKKIDNPDETPMKIMLQKLNDKERSNVDTVVKKKLSTKINQDVVTIDGKVYNTNEYKKINFENAKTIEVMRDGMLYRLRISAQNKVKIESVSPIFNVKAGEKPNKILDTAAEFSGINDAIRAITGRDPVTGDKVAGNDRLFSGLSVVPVAKIYKIGKYVFKLNKGEKAAKKVEKADTSINGAYDVAKSGGKHSGFYKQYIDKSPDQIKKGINSIDKQIAEHRDKIKNPEKHIPNFRNLDPRQQEALINKKWPSDIQRQIEQKQILEGILKLQ